MADARIDLVRLSRHADASHDIVFFPHAGGSPHQYRALASRLRIGRTCSGVLLPGRQGAFGARPLDNLLEAAEAAAACLASGRTHNLVLWGHSLGAILAYEVAVLLMKHDIQPSLLIVSGQNAPARTYPRAAIHDAEEAPFIDAMQGYGGTPPGFAQSQELRDLLIPTLRADFKMIETYAFDGRSVIASPILALAGTDDPFTDDDGCRAWAARTRAAFRLERLTGGHFFLQENIERIDSMLSALVGALDAPHPSHPIHGAHYE